jgi:hypothetical protein
MFPDDEEDEYDEEDEKQDEATVAQEKVKQSR